MTILTFGQKNFIYSGEDSNGVLLKIAKEIFDFADYNKDTKIELKFSCIDEQFNDLLDKRSPYDKYAAKSSKMENLNETSIISIEKFKQLLKQNENIFKPKNSSLNKNIFHKFSIDITKKFSAKTTSHIYIFDLCDFLIDTQLKNRESKNSLTIIYEILKGFSDQKTISSFSKDSKFEKLLHMILNKTYLIKGAISIFLFLSQKLESIEIVETAKKIMNLKASLPGNNSNNSISIKPSQNNVNETPISMHIDSLHDEQNTEVISTLENEVSFLKKMIMKKETDDHYKLSANPGNYLQDSARKFKSELYLKNNLLSQSKTNQNYSILRSNSKNLLNTTYPSSMVKPFMNFMSNSKIPDYGFNPENDYDINNIGNYGLFTKENNFRYGYEDMIMKENEDLKAQLMELKRTINEIVKEKDNNLKALYKVIHGHEETIKETEINYNEINLQYKQLLDQLKVKEDEIACLNEKLSYSKQNSETELKGKLNDIIQNNEKINILYNKEILKNNNLYIENEKLSADFQKLKATNEKQLIDLNKLTTEFNSNKTKLCNFESENNNLKTKIASLNNEVNELKKKVDFLKKKQINSSEKNILEPNKSTKVCKCEFYEKKVNSQNEEITKLQKELKDLKAKKVENVKKESPSQVKEIGKDHFIEYEKIIEESLNKIKELQQTLTITQEKNDYLEKLLLKREKENVFYTSEKVPVSTKNTNKKFNDFDIITPFSYKQEDDSFLDEIQNFSDNGFTKKKRKNKNSDLNEILGIVNFNQDDKEMN